MEEKNFKINIIDNTITLEKDNKRFTVSQMVDNDIIFYASQDELTFEINGASANYKEWNTYLIFESLMKSIIGRYILDGNDKKQFSNLPEDFIDLDNNIITWHSDSDIDNVLKIKYSNLSIRISISKCKNSINSTKNIVRIRTKGSSYEYYYQEFIDFFNHLYNLVTLLNSSTKEVSQEENKKFKRLFLFEKFSKK